MSPRQVQAARIAATVAPGLWAFAYPVTGRGLELLRRLALAAWLKLATWRIRSELG